MKIRLKDIGVADLDFESITLLRSFVKAAHIQEGFEIRLEDENIVHSVFKIGRNTKNARLRMDFLCLQRRIRKHLWQQKKQANDKCNLLLNQVGDQTEGRFTKGLRQTLN